MSHRTFKIIIECCQLSVNMPIILFIPVRSTLIIDCNAPANPKTNAQSNKNCSALVLILLFVDTIKIPNKENRYYGHLRNNTISTSESQVVGVDLSGTKGYYNKIKKKEMNCIKN